MKPKTLKNKWLKALRSGKYHQGQHVLHNKSMEAFCCLGVLCDVAGLESKDNIGTIFYSYENISDAIALPDNFADVIDLPEELEAKLMDMNDNGKSFPEIADYIEKNWNPE